MKFTDKYLLSLKPQEKIYQIRESDGFGIRVLPSGFKNFIFVYSICAKRRQMNLGDYPVVPLAKARERLIEARVALKDGKDPQEVGFEWHNNPERVRREAAKALEEEQNYPTVAKLIEEYIEKHAKKFKRSWETDLRILEKDAKAVWGTRRACEITKRDVVLLLEKIVDRGSPGSANNNFKIIRKMFHFAVERDILKFSPCDGVKMPAPLNTRERALSESEVRTLWTAAEEAYISAELKRALKLILLTGQRPGEVTGMHSSEIDGRWWTIPALRAKNGREHRVYLTDTALGLIGPLTVEDKKSGEMIPKGFIFPSPKAKKAQGIDPHALPVAVRRNQAWPVLDEKGNEVLDDKGQKVTENRLGIERFTPHDLRRTAATFMASLGFMDEVIDAVLNHVKQGIIRTYNRHNYDNEKKAALEAWETKLLSIVKENDGKVISLNVEKKNDLSKYKFQKR